MATPKDGGSWTDVIRALRSASVSLLQTTESLERSIQAAQQADIDLDNIRRSIAELQTLMMQQSLEIAALRRELGEPRSIEP
jgi:predicted RNase H-like nuclease (RuvC/YqgF family)